MQQITVSEVMDRNSPRIPSTMKLTELADLIAKSDPLVTRRQAIPIVDQDGWLSGIITRGDVLRALEQEDKETMTVLDAGNRVLLVTYPDELIHDAISKMLQNDIGRLPVVSRANPRELVGYLGRAAILEARLKRLNEENVREPGWLHRTAHK